MTIRIPKLSSEHFFGMFLVLFWGQDILFKYFSAVLLRIPYIKYFADYTIPALMLMCLIFAVPYFGKSISWKDGIFTIAVVTVFLMNIVIYPENESLLTIIKVFFVKIFPLYYIGLRIDIEKNGKLLFVMSIVNIFAYTFYYIVLNGEMVSGTQIELKSFMWRAYILLPQLLMVVIGTFRKPNWLKVLICIWGFILLLMCGNRGSVILALLFLAVEFFFISEKKKPLYTYIGVMSVSVIILHYWESLIVGLMSLFERYGMSIRVFSRFLDGTYFESSGRDSIIERLISAIKENPLVGYGLTSDRTITGSYAHNYAFEIWTAFGVVIGSLLLAATVYLILAAWRKSSDKTTKAFLLMLVCVGFLKLFISSSFLEEGLFFMLMGYCVGLVRKGSQNHLSKGDVNENL